MTVDLSVVCDAVRMELKARFYLSGSNGSFPLTKTTNCLWGKISCHTEHGHDYIMISSQPSTGPGPLVLQLDVLMTDTSTLKD